MKEETASPVGARKALDRLKPYSPGKPIWEVQEAYGLADVVKLASNENPLGPSPKAVEAIASMLGELHRYPDAGAVRLRRTLADRHGLRPEQLIVTNGADELITLISETFLEPGDEVIAPSPSFGEYEFGAALMGATVVPVPLREGWRYDAGDLLAAVTPRTKIVYICTPNNPTGTICPRGELERLLDGLPPGVLTVVDAAYSHYADAADYSDGLAFVAQGRPLLSLHTFSKAYGLAGIRVGWGAAPESVVRSILRTKEPFNVNALAQAAATAAVDDADHVARSVRLALSERERLYRAFDGMGLAYTRSMSNFILAELGEESAAVCAALLAEGVILRCGDIWGLPRHVRVTVGAPAENDRMLDALRARRRESGAI